MGLPNQPLFFVAAATAALSVWSAPARAADCGGAAIDARFTAAAAYCDKVESTAAVASTPAVVPAMPAVSVSMPGYRMRLAQAVRRVRASRAPNDALIAAIGARYRIDPRLLASMVHAESHGSTGAISNKGALGLMQVMPATARSVGVRDPKAMLTDPVLALSTGAVYLKRLQAQFGNNLPLVVAAYNAGPGAVRRAGMKVPNFRETRGYVGSVIAGYTARIGR